MEAGGALLWSALSVVAIFHYIKSWEKTDHVMVAFQGPPSA